MTNHKLYNSLNSVVTSSFGYFPFKRNFWSIPGGGEGNGDGEFGGGVDQPQDQVPGDRGGPTQSTGMKGPNQGSGRKGPTQGSGRKGLRV